MLLDVIKTYWHLPEVYQCSSRWYLYIKFVDGPIPGVLVKGGVGAFTFFISSYMHCSGRNRSSTVLVIIIPEFFYQTSMLHAHENST